MSVKAIAIGNVLMGDDGVAIRVAGKIAASLKQLGIDVITGETDFDYCLSRIADGDKVFIIDAACTGTSPGQITILPLNSLSSIWDLYSQHDINLPALLDLYKLSISGYIIGIEALSVSFTTELSSALEEKLNDISHEVLDQIQNLM